MGKDVNLLTLPQDSKQTALRLRQSYCACYTAIISEHAGIRQW